MKRLSRDKKKLKYIIVFFFIGLTIVSFHCVDKLLSIKSAHGIQQARDMYIQPRNSIDIVFMGSSHIHCDVNTAILWEDYGIAAYDYSAAEQPLWITYHYLKEICKYQTPKLVVLDLYSPARFKEDYQYEWLRDNLLGVKFSWNKLQMLYASCESEHYFEYFPNFVTYHYRYPTIEDVKYFFKSKDERASFKGYTPYFVESPQTEPELVEDKSGGITINQSNICRRS